MFDKLKSFLSCSDLTERQNGTAIKKRREIYRLILDFSFLPQIITATVLYMFVKGESAVLLDSFIAKMYLAVFIQIFAFSFLTVPKRFYWLRLFPVLAYLELIAAALVSGYVSAWLRFFAFAFMGILTCAVNLCALYGWRQMKNNN